MSKKVAASYHPRVAEDVAVRAYDEEQDKAAVEEMERRCDLGQCGKPSIVTDLMGDPLCRVRHFPSYFILVAEHGKERKIVGVVRGCVKNVTRGFSRFVKVACVLGLRVSPAHRNLGIGTRLVQALEEWFKRQGAQYAYMATDCKNAPSINLFTKKCSYIKFRTPSVLVQPIQAHAKPTGSNISILRLSPRLAKSICLRIFANSEFFPDDIGDILSSHHSRGTFMAVPRKHVNRWKFESSDIYTESNHLPSEFAILSVWSTKKVFRLQVKGVSAVTRMCCKGTRFMGSCLPWLGLPSFPDVFGSFWVYFMYGLHMKGESGPKLMTALCSFVHNMGRFDEGCGAVVAELGPRDPVRAVVPHWKRLSLTEDLWCLKKLTGENTRNKSEPSDWIESRSSSSSSVIFVDPRDI